MRGALKAHWPEYLMEAAELGLFMMSACGFSALLEHPGSPVRQAISDPLARRVLMGLAMGSTAIAIIYSPLGKRSGAHFNPSVSLAFFRLGRMPRADAMFYGLFQFLGAVGGVALAAAILPAALVHPAVNYVVTTPGPSGAGVAFLAEALIAFLQMTLVLHVSNRRSIASYTGLLAGVMVAAFITIEAPFSGMSMNPARSFGSAFSAGLWNSLWIYFTAPPLGMLAAAELYLRRNGVHGILCAKLHHANPHRCIFNCKYGTTA